MECVEELLNDLSCDVSSSLSLDNWAIITKFLPKDWKNKAFELKALKHTDEPLGNPETLLKVFLIYLTNDCGLRQAAVKAVESGLVPKISSVALWKRLGKASKWFAWMCNSMKDTWIKHLPKTTSTLNKKIKIVDATHVMEKAAVTTTWRIHYAIELDTLQCDELLVTSPKTGESLANFNPNPEDLYIGDRIYATEKGIKHITKEKADVLLRHTPHTLRLNDEFGNKVDYLMHLKTLKQGECKEWRAFTGEGIPLRVCAVRKSNEATEKSIKKLKRRASKHGHKLQEITLKLAKYIIIVTTLKEEEFSLEQVLETYRCRWLIELVFKRLKSLLNIGGIPKKKTPGAHAWLYGKLLIALLAEAMIHAGESFFPWGYPLEEGYTG